MNTVKALVTVLTLGCAASSHAMVIDINFEDLDTRDSFHTLNISDSYLGFNWGYGNAAGAEARVLPTNRITGWASHTVDDTASGPMPADVGGSSAAWNWNGPQSLWIDFGAAMDFLSGRFAVLGTTFSNSASTVQLFGYDADFNEVDSSDVLSLSDTYQSLEPAFTGIHALEIRANADGRWFSVDDLAVRATSVVSEVPEPGSLALLGMGLMSFAVARRRQLDSV